jgi:hypothetical protein
LKRLLDEGYYNLLPLSLLDECCYNLLTLSLLDEGYYNLLTRLELKDCSNLHQVSLESTD